MNKIDWESGNNILINDRMLQSDQQKVQQMISHMDHIHDHIWIATSGSTSVKWVALSKKAVLASAENVNAHLNSTVKDTWINPLPIFHVGGLGIIARCYLSKAKMINAQGKWDAQKFYSQLIQSAATLTSLVPTQVHDLVKNELPAPKSLRSVIVGGGVLQESLYKQATALGWPLLPSYGMTECASQIATASLNDPRLKVLPHLKIKIVENRICIKGSSLLTGFVDVSKPDFIDPKKEEWFYTDDIGELQGDYLKVIGRSGDFIKIGGESTNMIRLNAILDEVKTDLKITTDSVLVAISDERLGHVIHLAAQEAQPILVKHYNENVLPFERIRGTDIVPEIPRTPLGKLKKDVLFSMIKK